MGCGPSKPSITAESGTEAEYKSIFEEEKLLGQGEFGAVKLAFKKSSGPNGEHYAVKILNKGFVFKDNTLYTPMKPEVLKMEIDILRKLDGKKYNLALDSVYESSSKVYLVTEICSGGEMLEYTSKNKAEGLRTEDVSRIAYQLLSAVDHCDRHNVLHRDIKPENIMFKANTPTSELRLIDFGCATMDEERDKEHTTFAGTPFYISPELFQKKYTTKTDVFSVGVVLYVLVAGYPADQLQAAFNLLQKANRDLKSLPGMPENDMMPDTYYEMLGKMLKYQWKARQSAAEILKDDEFVMFHKDLEKEEKGALQSSKRERMARTASVLLSGTGAKAAAAFGFTKFQRAVTTILATMMDRGNIVSLVAEAEAKETSSDGSDKKLGVITVKDLKSILKEMKKLDCVAAIEKQKNAESYDNYSYEYTLLKPFTKKPDTYNNGHDENGDVSTSSRTFRTTMTNAVSGRDLSSSDRINKTPKRMQMSKAQSVMIRGI